MSGMAVRSRASGVNSTNPFFDAPGSAAVALAAMRTSTAIRDPRDSESRIMESPLCSEQACWRSTSLSQGGRNANQRSEPFYWQGDAYGGRSGQHRAHDRDRAEDRDLLGHHPPPRPPFGAESGDSRACPDQGRQRVRRGRLALQFPLVARDHVREAFETKVIGRGAGGWQRRAPPLSLVPTVDPRTGQT